MVDGDQGACTGANCAGAFSGASDQEAGVVDEVHYRNVERVADVDQPDHLVASGGVGRAAAVARVVGHDADRVAIEARKPRNQRAAVIETNFEERVAVEDGVEDAADVVSASPVARNERRAALLRGDRPGRRSARRGGACHTLDGK